ncbi:hypothetical protein BH11PAT1_BH11PAT1_1280 [soil metagenome]
MALKITASILILLGIFLRLYQLDTLPGGIFSDEISIAVNAKTIAENGVDEYGRTFPFGFESLSDYKMPLYIYLTAGVYKILGPIVLTVHMVAAISSVISIFLLGYFTYILFPRKKNLFYYAMISIAFCFLHIHFSRIAYETMLSTTFLLIYLIALYQTIHYPTEKKWLIIGSIGIIFSLWSYYAARFIIPVFTFLVCLVCLYRIEKNKKLVMRNIVIYLLVTTLAFIPALLGANVDKRPASYLLIDVKGQTLIEKIFSKMQSIAASFLWMFNLEFLFQKGDVFAYRHGTKEVGIYPSLFVVPYLVAVVQLLKIYSIKNFSIVYISLFALIASLPSALTSGVPYAPRLLPMLIPFSLLIAYGMYYSIEFINKQKLFAKATIYIVIAIIFVYQILSYSHIYFIHFKKTSLPEFPVAPVQLGEEVKNIHKTEPGMPIYFLGGKSCHNWGHDDLHLWYFANLPNEAMIIWNNLYREKRYNTVGSPFDAYDSIQQPRFSFSSIVMNPSEYEIKQAIKGAYIIRCGYHLPTIDLSGEKIMKVYYMDTLEHTDPFYVMTRKT